jgi:hypothetical protein
VEVELARTQSWIETADPILFGDGKSEGVVAEHQNAKAGRKALERFVKIAVGVAAFMSTIPAAIKVLELMHIIPK